MTRILTALAFIAAAFTASPAVADETEPSIHSDAVLACLAAHPGAITFDLVQPAEQSNDVVCVDEEFVGSLGDDTYLWVGADLDPKMELRGDQTDAGQDTLSLADWTHGYVETEGGMFGVRYFAAVPETVRYTEFADVVGFRDACAGLTESSNINFITGAGADLVQCITGNIFTGVGDDVIFGVTLDTYANAGPGADRVIGDAGADQIFLGSGPDVARVEGGGSDVVLGGAGKDVVYASRNDTVTSARIR